MKVLNLAKEHHSVPIGDIDVNGTAEVRVCGLVGRRRQGEVKLTERILKVLRVVRTSFKEKLASNVSGASTERVPVWAVGV